MTEFQAGLAANAAHSALKSAVKTMADAKQNAVLWFGEILERKLYRELGYSSINQYAKLELGFSTSRTGDFLQLCRTFKKLPKVKEKVAAGELGYTSARVLARVADVENEEGWLDFALQNSRRELEREVKLARQEACDEAVGQALLIPAAPKARPDRPAAVVPVRVCMELSPVQFARYEALWEQVRKRRNAAADKVEALLEIMAAYVTESSPRGELSPAGKPPVQIHIHQCPTCEQATVQTSRGELEIGAAELERALCDCQITRLNERSTSSIPPALRRQVLARARHKCQRVGCDHTQFLEIHHKIPRSRGGTNDLANLTCLCAGCHQLVHEKAVFLVKAPPEIYNWQSGDFSAETWRVGKQWSGITNSVE